MVEIIIIDPIYYIIIIDPMCYIIVMKIDYARKCLIAVTSLSRTRRKKVPLSLSNKQYHSITDKRSKQD